MNILPGQKVAWTEVTGKGRSLVFATVTVEVIRVDGPLATIKLRNNHRKLVHVRQLTPAGEPTELTQVVKEVVKRAREKG